MIVREKLKRLRNDLGLSQMDFSERVGLAYTTYRSIETGRQSCPRHVADKLAELFGLDAERFSTSPMIHTCRREGCRNAWCAAQKSTSTAGPYRSLWYCPNAVTHACSG